MRKNIYIFILAILVLSCGNNISKSKGELVGIKGKKYNGNNFADEAIKNGAILAIVNKKYKNSKIIFEPKTLKFLNRISSIYRKRNI